MQNKIDKYIKNNSKVISLVYGVGKIRGNFPVYDGVNDYLEVEYFSDNKVKHFCVKHISDVRLISSKKSIEKALSWIHCRLDDPNLENEKSRDDLSFFEKDVEYIARVIVELCRKTQLTVKDNLLLHSFIDSLIVEVGEVYGVEKESARGIVSDYLKCA